MTPDEQRREWFRSGAEAIEFTLPAAVREGHDGPTYICPLCWRLFDETALDSPPELTIEHVPPSSLGGSGLVLTCRRCNNDAGTQVDADAAKHRVTVEALRGEAGRVEMRINGDVTAELEVTAEGEGRIFVSEQRSNPSTREALMAQLPPVASDGSTTIDSALRNSLEITFRPGYDPGSAKLSYLRSAYLALFALYGYRALLSSALAPLREVLRDLDSARLPAFPVLRTQNGRTGQIWAAVHEELGGVLVFCFGDQAVVLPDPLRADESWWTRLSTTEPGSRFKLEALVTWPIGPQHLLDLRVPAESSHSMTSCRRIPFLLDRLCRAIRRWVPRSSKRQSSDAANRP